MRLILSSLVLLRTPVYTDTWLHVSCMLDSNNLCVRGAHLPLTTRCISISTSSARLPSPTRELRSAVQNARRVGSAAGWVCVGH